MQLNVYVQLQPRDAAVTHAEVAVIVSCQSRRGRANVESKSQRGATRIVGWPLRCTIFGVCLGDASLRSDLETVVTLRCVHLSQTVGGAHARKALCCQQSCCSRAC